MENNRKSWKTLFWEKDLKSKMVGSIMSIRQMNVHYMVPIFENLGTVPRYRTCSSVVYLVLIPWKFQATWKLLTADANDILWHFFHRTLFFQAFRDFLVWYPSCAWAVFFSRAASKIVSVCSQYRESVPNTVIPDTAACFFEHDFVKLNKQIEK